MLKEGDIIEKIFTVSDEVYQGFISVFNDRNPLHTDEAYAIEKGFKSRVMHGNILGGFLSYLIGECLPEKNIIIHSQEIRYRRPVYLHDKLKLTAEVIQVSESVKTIEIKFQFENQDNVKVALGKIQIGYI